MTIFNKESREIRHRLCVLCSKIDFLFREKYIDIKKYESLLHLIESPDVENLTVVESIVDSILLT